MARKKIDELTKELGFNNPQEYLDYIAETFEGGNRKLAKNLFKKIKPPEDENALMYMSMKKPNLYEFLTK